jgi:hypothetical protein
LSFSTRDREEVQEQTEEILAHDLPELLGASIWLVTTNPKLYFSQFSFARILLRAEHMPITISQALKDQTMLEGGSGLLSGDALGASNLLTLGAIAMSPNQLGLVVHRGIGSLVIYVRTT